VLIVGGGVSGLAAANRLGDAGIAAVGSRALKPGISTRSRYRCNDEPAPPNPQP